MSVLPDDQMNSVINCLTAKSTWDDVILYHEGPSDVKESRVMDLKLCYNTFKFKEGKSLTQTFTRYKALMNELVNDSINLSKLEINIGFINGLPKKWLSFCQSLKNTNHVKDFELASLFGKLEYEENLIDSIYETKKNESFVSATPLHTSFFLLPLLSKTFKIVLMINRIQGSSHKYLNNLEEYQARALLAKSKRFFKKGTQRFSSAKATDQTECHKCGKKGYFVRDWWSKTLVPSYQSPFQSKSLSSSQHKPELRPTKDFEAKYNKVKAKLTLLSSSASASKASMVKNKAEDNDAVSKEGARNGEWVKISMRNYLHKYVEQPGPKVVFGDDSTCTTEGYGSIKCNGIVFTKVAFVDGLKSNNHEKYTLVIVDEYSRYTWVYFLKKKSQAPETIMSFIKRVENQNDIKVKQLRTDNGTEFRNSILVNFCDEKGISQNFSSPYTPEQNGVAERKNRTLIEAARTMLSGSKKQTEETYHITFDESPDAIKFSKPLVNNINIAEIERYPPDEYLHPYKPSQRYQTNYNDVSFIEPYGYPKPVVLKTKVSSDQNGQIDHNDQNDQSVQNDEILNDDHYEHSNHTNDEKIIDNILNTKHIQVSEHLSSPSVKDTSVQNTIPISTPPLPIPSMVTPAPQNRWSQDKHIELVNIIGNPVAGMLTRAMAKQLSVASAHKCLFVDFLSEEEPKKVSEALKHLRWVDAMQDELNQFDRNKVCTLVPAPYGKTIIGSKWFSEIKEMKLELSSKTRQDLWLEATISKKT
ncbi:retrovirus-related pol polyprotein from transposon TNT 1-94 [Tanacetum coccineum]